MDEYIFSRLAKSKFRSSFHLKDADREYISNKCIDKIQSHAIDFIKKKLSNPSKVNDGKQTPMRGHPVFIAQHATATCCRGCIYKWYGIEPTHILTDSERERILSVIMRWITNETKND